LCGKKFDLKAWDRGLYTPIFVSAENDGPSQDKPIAQFGKKGEMRS